MNAKRTFLAALALALVALPGVASSASASFHEMKVREVYPGTVAAPDSGYVELQMWAPGQTLVSLGQLRVYNANGTTASTFSPNAYVSGGANNSTILIADSTFGTAFPSVTPDFPDPSLDLNPAGGAVCWPVNAVPIDCASWGNFTGGGSLPSPGDSSPFQGGGTSGAITDGMAIRRSISAGCSTLLEDSDDTNSGTADFSEVTPAPRPNSVAPTEVACSTGGPTGYPPPSPGTGYPTTKKKCKKPKHRAAAFAAKKCKKRK